MISDLGARTCALDPPSPPTNGILRVGTHHLSPIRASETQSARYSTRSSTRATAHASSSPKHRQRGRRPCSSAARPPSTSLRTVPPAHQRRCGSMLAASSSTAAAFKRPLRSSAPTGTRCFNIRWRTQCSCGASTCAAARRPVWSLPRRTSTATHTSTFAIMAPMRRSRRRCSRRRATCTSSKSMGGGGTAAVGGGMQRRYSRRH
jgi:hypothetical protein